MLIVVRDLRPCEMWRPSRFNVGPSTSSDPKRKNATKGNRKVPRSSRRLSSLFPLGSMFPASDHPPSSFLLSHDESQGRRSIDRSIDRFPRTRSIRRLRYAENSGRARQRLITISVLRDLSLLSQKSPPFRESLSSDAVSSFSSSPSSSSSSPFTSLWCCGCCVILL